MPVPSEAFSQGDVYIDYPQEDVMFRFVKDSERIFRRFYDETTETETDRGSELFAQARLIGVVTTADRYFATPGAGAS